MERMIVISNGWILCGIGLILWSANNLTNWLDIITNGFLCISFIFMGCLTIYRGMNNG
jgi:hypothetical protein